MVDEVEGWVDVRVSMGVLPEAAALLLVHPSSSYIFPVDESYFMFWRKSKSDDFPDLELSSEKINKNSSRNYYGRTMAVE